MHCPAKLHFYCVLARYISPQKNCHIMKVNQEDGLPTFLARNKEQVCHCRFQSEFFYYTCSPNTTFEWQRQMLVKVCSFFYLVLEKNVRIFWHRVDIYGKYQVIVLVPILVMMATIFYVNEVPYRQTSLILMIWWIFTILNYWIFYSSRSP